MFKRKSVSYTLTMLLLAAVLIMLNYYFTGIKPAAPVSQKPAAEDSTAITDSTNR